MKHEFGDAWKESKPWGFEERRKRKPVLGMRLRDFDVDQSATYVLTTPRTAEQGVGLFVTPNIQHVALARRDPDFALAMEKAQIVICDGFPVFRYAQWQGQDLPGRITGREVVEKMFADPTRLFGHRIFLVVDSDETAAGVAEWVGANAPGVAFETHVPPFGFDTDQALCDSLADRIRAFETSLLFMCVGAPRSEVFVHRQRSRLPACWALCVGQSFRLMFGMVAPPPALMVRLNLEWFWRLLLEPRRMARRYGPSALGFLAAVAKDARR